MSTYGSFFPPYISCPFRFPIFVFFCRFLYFYYFTKMKAYTVCAIELRNLFLRSSGYSVEEIGKLLKKSEVNKWSKVKTLEDKPRRWWLLFCKYVTNAIEKAVSMSPVRKNSTRQKGKKNSTFNNIKVSSTTVWRCMTNKGWKALKRKRQRTCGHGVRKICKLESQGWTAGKLTWCKPSRDHLEYRLRDNIKRSSTNWKQWTS